MQVISSIVILPYSTFLNLETLDKKMEIYKNLNIQEQKKMF